MPRKMKAVPEQVGYAAHGHGGGMGLLLLVLGAIGFAISYGLVNIPFWPTVFVVAGLWKLLMKKCC